MVERNQSQQRKANWFNNLAELYTTTKWSFINKIQFSKKKQSNHIIIIYVSLSLAIINIWSLSWPSETIYNFRTGWWATKTRGSLRRTPTTTSRRVWWRLHQAASTSNQQVSPHCSPPVQHQLTSSDQYSLYLAPALVALVALHYRVTVALISTWLGSPLTIPIMSWPSLAKSKTNSFIQFLNPEILISDIIVSNYFHQPEVKFPGKILLWLDRL